jgi:hypothetical protein
VAGLAFCGGTEQCCDFGVTLDVSFVREVQITTIGLALTCKSILQMLVSLGTFELRHHFSPLVKQRKTTFENGIAPVPTPESWAVIAAELEIEQSAY